MASPLKNAEPKTSLQKFNPSTQSLKARKIWHFYMYLESELRSLLQSHSPLSSGLYSSFPHLFPIMKATIN